MAGVGFDLRRLGDRDGVLAPAASLGLAACVAAGPWLFTVLSMVILHQATAAIEDKTAIYSFRAVVIYAFALTLLVTASVVSVTSRLVADDIYLGRFTRVRSRFVAALALSMALSAVAACAVFGGYFRFPAADLVVAVAATSVVGGLWPGLALCTAVRNYKAVTFAFAGGLVVAVVATVWMAFRWPEASLILIAFIAGIGIVQQALVWAVLETFGPSVWTPIEAVKTLLKGMGRYWVLALGATFSVVALWVDKWVIWLSPEGQATGNGLLNAPAYDGAMFVAYLIIIPGLALFITVIETTFFEACRAYFAAVRHHDTLTEIGRRADRLRIETYSALSRILLVQATLSAVLALAAPAVVEAVGLQYQQVGILRMGLIAGLFQFIFLACSSLLVFFDQHARFAWLQVSAFLFQAGLTAGTLQMGPELLGLGHLIASALSGFLSMLVVERTFCHLEYLTFRSAWRFEAAAARAHVRELTHTTRGRSIP